MEENTTEYGVEEEYNPEDYTPEDYPEDNDEMKAGVTAFEHMGMGREDLNERYLTQALTTFEYQLQRLTLTPEERFKYIVREYITHHPELAIDKEDIIARIPELTFLDQKNHVAYVLGYYVAFRKMPLEEVETFLTSSPNVNMTDVVKYSRMWSIM